MRLIGVFLWSVGMVLFLWMQQQAVSSKFMRAGAIFAMIAGALLATWGWFLAIARQNGILNYIVGASGGLSMVGLGIVFLQGTKLVATPETKRRRQLAILVIVLGVLVSIFDLLRVAHK